MVDPVQTGVLVIDKAKGPTSHDVIVSLRRLLQLRRIGHCGTLDPLASGVLVVCLGRYTRLNRWLSGADKEYEAEICLGAVSATGDAEGPIRHQADCASPTDQSVAQALRDFTGVIDQVPPAHSAVKVAGVRSYKRARRGGRARPQIPPSAHSRNEIAQLRFSQTKGENPLLCGNVHPLASRRSGTCLGDGCLFSGIAPTARRRSRAGQSPDVRPSSQSE